MTLAERIAKKAREEFGYTTFNGLCMIGVTEEKLAALIAAELEERDAKIRKALVGLSACLLAACSYPACMGAWPIWQKEIERGTATLALLEGGDDG